MGLDPDVRRLLDTILVPRRPPFDAMSLRLGHQASIGLLGGSPPSVRTVDGFTVDPDSRWQTPRLAVRRYRPDGEARRAIVWLHGGGWVVGTLDGFDGMARALANASGSQVFLVDYRLAPEAPYPGAIADCCAAFHRIVQLAPSFGVDPARIVLGGDSAGGHLTITTARWLAAAGLPLPAALLLLYPATDARMQDDSYLRFADGYHLTAAQMAWFWARFAPQGTWRDGQPVTDAHSDLSPVLANDLGRLPQSLVVTAEYDVLHDEGVAFRDALVRAGVAAAHVDVPGMIHGFIRFRGAVRQADAVLGMMAGWLDRRRV